MEQLQKKLQYFILAAVPAKIPQQKDKAFHLYCIFGKSFHSQNLLLLTTGLRPVYNQSCIGWKYPRTSLPHSCGIIYLSGSPNHMTPLCAHSLTPL